VQRDRAGSIRAKIVVAFRLEGRSSVPWGRHREAREGGACAHSSRALSPSFSPRRESRGIWHRPRRNRATIGQAAITPAPQKLPGLELFLPLGFWRAGHVLAQAPSGAACAIELLRVRRARRRRYRAEIGRPRIFDRSRRRRLSVLRDRTRPAGQTLRSSVPGRASLPRLDLPAAGLRYCSCTLLPQGSDQAAAPAAVLYFRRGALVMRI
jgi:hypothetical protein